MVNQPQSILKSIIDLLRDEGSTCHVHWEKVKLYDIGPQEFLSFARQDLEEDSEKGRVNAITNAKRAIECRVDEILTLSNLKGFSSRNRWGLPYKLRVLRTLGVVAPGVLTEYIASKRNLLEHAYVRPSPEETRHLADITELFLSATDKYVGKGYGSSATIGHRTQGKRQKINTRRDRSCDIGVENKLEFDLKNGTLRITTTNFNVETDYDRETGKIEEHRELDGEPDISDMTINDCDETDVRDLIKLIWEKAD